MSDVLTKFLRDSRRGLAGFAIGTALAGAMYAGFYPQVAEGGLGQTVEGFSPEFREALNMQDVGSAAGYLGSSVFGIIVPLIVVIYGIAFGTRALAGDEESGYLDLLLAHPVSRTRIVLSRFGALAAGAGLIGGLVWLVMLAERSGAKLESISVAGFAAQCLALALLATLFGAVAMAIGAATGSRAAALGGTAVVAVLGYAGHTVAGQVGADWARYASPFHWYIGGEPLRNGFQWVDLAVLALASGVLVAVAVAAFGRRDLRS